MAKNILNGKPYYIVKWYGYCASQNTWEPKDHLPADLVSEENRRKQRLL